MGGLAFCGMGSVEVIVSLMGVQQLPEGPLKHEKNSLFCSVEII
jgi:hypothetical protein